MKLLPVILIGAAAYFLLSKKTAAVTYYNKYGATFRPGTDTESYWFNSVDRTWYRGLTDGTVQAVVQPPFIK